MAKSLADILNSINEKEPAGELAWRKKQRPQSIMSAKEFKKIERKARKSGASDPKKVAGSAYWKTVRAKYKESK